MDHIVLYYLVGIQAVAADKLTTTCVTFPQLLGVHSPIANYIFRATEKAFFAYLNL